MSTSSEVIVRLGELRTAAENLNSSADIIDAAVANTNNLVDGLMAMGFVSPAASAFHTRFVNNETVMNSWPRHVRDFAVLLTHAAEQIEEAVGSNLHVDAPDISALESAEDIGRL